MRKSSAYQDAGIGSITERYTPRDLINLHIQYPKRSITNDDIENLALGISIVDTNFLDLETENIMVVV